MHSTACRLFSAPCVCPPTPHPTQPPQVKEVRPGNVVCEAKNNALLDGLLTVFHQERSSDALDNVQNDLPALTDFDKHAIATLCE